MKVRKAVLGDLKRIQELNLMLFENEYEKYDDKLDLNWTFGKEGTSHFKHAIKGNDSCAFVAEDRKKIVGYLVGSEIAGESYRRLPKMAEIDNMLVLAECRGKGVGKMLYDEFASWSRARDVKMVQVQATAQNREAIAYYHKMGLKDYTLVLEGEI